MKIDDDTDGETVAVNRVMSTHTLLSG